MAPLLRPQSRWHGGRVLGHLWEYAFVLNRRAPLRAWVLFVVSPTNGMARFRLGQSRGTAGKTYLKRTHEHVEARHANVPGRLACPLIPRRTRGIPRRLPVCPPKQSP